MTTNFIRPTDEQTDEVINKMLIAAYDELKGISYNCDTVYDALPRVLKAFAAANRIEEEESDKFQKEHATDDDNRPLGYDTDKRGIVASALCADLCRINIHDMHPYSQGGTPIAAFAVASISMERFSDFLGTLDTYPLGERHGADVLEYIKEGK